jgi:Hydroxypyruvate isomerase
LRCWTKWARTTSSSSTTSITCRSWRGTSPPPIRANIARIKHIQLADNPGRGEPGTGEINYPFLFKAIDDTGYDGWIGCEYKPKTTADEGIGWFAPYKG